MTVLGLQYCVVCDMPHLFQNAAMLMPTCCNTSLCTYAFIELNVGKDAADGISNSTEVMNLLVSISRAAVCSRRMTQVRPGTPPPPARSHSVQPNRGLRIAALRVISRRHAHTLPHSNMMLTGPPDPPRYRTPPRCARV